MSKNESNLPANWMTSSVYYGFVDTRAVKDSNRDGFGDIPGLISKLDYLRDIGVGAILFAGSLQPTDFAYGGTMITRFRDVDPRYGTVDDLENLVVEAHRRGVAIVDGWTPNSTHTDHDYFAASRDPGHPQHAEFRDYFCWTDDPNEPWFTVGGHWEWDDLRGEYFHAWWQTVDGRWCPETNPYSERVRAENELTVRWLLERGIDGLWIDVGAGGSFRNETDRIAASQELNRIIHSYPNKLSIAEGGPANVQRIIYAMGYDGFFCGLPAWETVFKGQTYVTGHLGRESQGIHEALMASYSLPKANQSIFIYGIPEALDLADSSNAARIKQYFALTATLPVAPMHSVGAECGFNGNAEKPDDIWEHTVPMMWNSTEPNYGFTTGEPYGRVNPHGYPATRAAEDQRSDENSILSCFAKLMNLRKVHAALQANDRITDSYRRVPTQDDSRFYTFIRSASDGEEVLVAFNFGDAERELHLDFAKTRDHKAPETNTVDLFTGKKAVPISGNAYSLVLPAHGFRILQLVE